MKPINWREAVRRLVAPMNIAKGIPRPGSMQYERLLQAWKDADALWQESVDSPESDYEARIDNLRYLLWWHGVPKKDIEAAEFAKPPPKLPPSGKARA